VSGGPATLLAATALLTGCASHLITSAQPDGSGIAGQPYSVSQLSIAGERGLNSGGATGHVASECRGTALTRVEVHRDFLQGLVNVLTLGIVAPATIRFYCAKPDIPEAPPTGDPDEF
jgi:hypothetical protein